MKQIIVSGMALVCCLVFAACGRALPEETVLQYKEEKIQLEEQSFPYEDFSDEYGQLIDYCVDDKENVVFLYGNREEADWHIIAYTKETDSYEVLPIQPENNTAICNIMTAPDGSVVLFDTIKAFFYHPQEEASYGEISAWYEGGMVFTEDDRVICQAYGDSAYFSYDLHSFDKPETYLERDFLMEEGKYQPFLYGQGQQLFLITAKGLYENIKGEWLQQIPAERTSLSKPGFKARKIEKNQDNSYYVYDDFFRYHYFLVEKDDRIQPVTIKVNACQDRYTLKSAIAEYQIEHPEITIEYQFQCVEEPGNTQEMNTLIQQMNLEVTGSSPADLYVLDKLPWEDYVKKGYFQDMSKVLLPYMEDDAYFNNVLKAYEVDGAVYTLPWFFTGQAVLCKKEMASSVLSIHTLAEYLVDNPQTPGLVPYFYQNRPDIFLAKMYELYGTELMEDGHYTQESIVHFLTSAQVIYDRIQENIEAVTPDYQVHYSNMSQFPMEELYLLWEKQEGSMAVLPLIPMNMECLTQLSYHPEYEAVPMDSIQGQFLFGIHSKSAHTEETEKLLLFLMEYFQQYGKSDASVSMFDFLPGIPIARQCLQDDLLRWEQNASVNGSVTSGEKKFYTVSVGGEEEYPIYYSSQEDVAAINNLLNQYDKRGAQADSFTDSVYRVYEERSRGYLTGERSLDEVASDLYQGLSLLEKEKE